eukprot:1621127-Pleurochrysis_carterae.AAC.2
MSPRPKVRKPPFAFDLLTCFSPRRYAHMRSAPIVHGAALQGGGGASVRRGGRGTRRRRRAQAATDHHALLPAGALAADASARERRTALTRAARRPRQGRVMSVARQRVSYEVRCWVFPTKKPPHRARESV